MPGITPNNSFLQKLPLIGHIAGISCVILIQRHLTFYFDTLTLNYFRLTAGAIALLTVSMFLYPGEVANAFRQKKLIGNLVVLALIACIAQFLIIEGLAYTSATLVGLLRVIGIIIGVVIAYVFFHDERTTITGRKFKAGAFLAIIGIVGVILGEKETNIEYSLGSLYTVFGIFIASTGTVFQKKVVTSMHPFSAAGLVTGMMSLVYAGVSYAWGDIAHLASVPWYVLVFLFVSGVFGLFVGVGLGFITIRNFGVIKHRLALLAVPLIVGVLSYFLLHERLTTYQMLSGAMLLTGCYLVIRERSTST